jgi:predicted DNA-binding ribbon-helix-helix protein
MKSLVVKRSVIINGHKTSISLEDAFWRGLKKIAHNRSQTLSEIVSTIDDDRRHGNLSSAIRVFVLQHFRNENKRTDVAIDRLSTVGSETISANQP